MMPQAPGGVVLGAGSQKILDANPMRRSVVITNDSATDITVYLSFSNPAVVNKGLPLFVTNWYQPDDGEVLNTVAMWAIGASPGAILTIQEFL